MYLTVVRNCILHQWFVSDLVNTRNFEEIFDRKEISTKTVRFWKLFGSTNRVLLRYFRNKSPLLSLPAVISYIFLLYKSWSIPSDHKLWYCTTIFYAVLMDKSLLLLSNWQNRFCWLNIVESTLILVKLTNPL